MFYCKVSLKYRCQCALKTSNFQNGTFEIIIITVTEIVLIQVFLFIVASKQKNKKHKYGIP